MLRQWLRAYFARSSLHTFRVLTFTTAIAVTILSAFPSTSFAYSGGLGDAVGDAVGIVTDPVKLGRASDNLLQAVQPINAMLPQVAGLEGKTNDDLRDRIAQVQAIVDRVIAAVDQNVSNLQSIVAEAEHQMNDLENKIFLDAQALLRQVQCLAHDMLTVQVPQGFASALRELRQADPSIRIFGLKVGDLTTNDVQVEDPFGAYMSAKQQLLNSLDQLGPDAPAYSISHTYGTIANLAYLTRCGDLGNTQPATDAMLLRDELKYEQLQAPWSTVVIPSL
jgi:hypothetical protein